MEIRKIHAYTNLNPRYGSISIERFQHFLIQIQFFRTDQPIDVDFEIPEAYHQRFEPRDMRKIGAIETRGLSRDKSCEDRCRG